MPADHLHDGHEHGEHGHDSDAGHSHAVKEDADTQRLSTALGLIVSFMAAEVTAIAEIPQVRSSKFPSW